MKVLIKENALQLHSRTVPAHMGYTKYQFKYRDMLRELEGKWVEVEKENNYSYDIITSDGSTIGVDKEFVEDVKE